MDIYIKLLKKVVLNNKDNVTIGDIAEIVASSNIIKDISKIIVFKKDNTNNKDIILISVIDMVSSIKEKYPEYIINNLGETNTLVEFRDKEEKESIIFKWLKISFVTSVLLTGCATAIITFHTDSQLNQIFDNYKQIIFGQNINNNYIMEISYSVGVALGIIVFFNHFAGKKITDDPTPIEVEMSTYESNVLDTVKENLEIDEEEG